MNYPLEPSPGAMRAMGDAALSFLLSFLEGLPEAPSFNTESARELARELRGSAPEDGGSFDDVLQTFVLAASKVNETAGPGYLAYIPGGGLFSAAVADFLAAGTNRFVNLWAQAPALVQMENDVVRWLCDLFAFPPGSRGILTSGGSLANFSAVVTARKDRLPEDFLKGTLYVSHQVHASVTKAASLAGFPLGNIRRVACTPELRMDVEALRSALRADRSAGLQPFCVIPSAGTTNTGAVDPLEAIADVAAEEELWMHVDAAYGGFFHLTERGRERFVGIERADSITLDPHKGMFLPYGVGALVVRDGEKLRDAHYSGAAYLQDLPGEDELPNFAEYSPELSRDFRGLRVWLPLKLHGVSAFREALDEKLDLARVLYEGLREIPGLEVPWEPDLTTVPFRVAEGADGDPNTLTQQLLDRINASKRVFLSSTMLDGRFTIRPCILSHRTHRDRIDEALDITAKSAAEILS